MPKSFAILIGLVTISIGIGIFKDFNKLAHKLQDYYIRISKKGGFLVMSPKYWDTPFFLFVCKALVVFFALWLAIVGIALEVAAFRA